MRGADLLRVGRMSLMFCLSQHIYSGLLVEDARYSLSNLLTHISLMHFTAQSDIVVFLRLIHQVTPIAFDAHVESDARGEISDKL